MGNVRTIIYAGRKWNVFSFIRFFHDPEENFKQCAIEEVLSYFQRKDSRITREDVLSYMREVYGKESRWEGT